MVFLHSSANTVLLVAHSDRGHFNWCIPLAQRLKSAGLRVELWTNGLCEEWVPSGTMDKIESTKFDDGKRLQSFVGCYKAIVGEGDSDPESYAILCGNGFARVGEFCGTLGVAAEDLAKGYLSVGGQTEIDAFRARVKEHDVAFVIWECVWAKHAAAAAEAAGKPHMGINVTYMRPFRAAYQKEPMMDFDAETRVRNEKEDIVSDFLKDHDGAFVLARCLQGQATDTGGRPRFGAFLPRKSEIGGGFNDTELEEWLGKDGKVTVISLGSQSVLSNVSAWAEADLLKGCLAASPRVLIAATSISEDPELQEAVTAGKLRACAWLPLWNVLGHSNVGCFVSHCGANSVHECLAQAKPIVPIPLFDDQFYIAVVVEELMGYTAQSSFAPVRKQILRAGKGAGIATVEAAVKLGLAVSSDAMAKIQKGIWKEDGAAAAVKAIKSKIAAAPKLRKPKFRKVSGIKPEDSGLNLKLKVVKIEEDTSAKNKAWEVVAGDASAVVTLRLSNNDHTAACQPGACIRIQNARVLMIKGFIRVIVDKWGVLAVTDSPLDIEVKSDQDVSATEYEMANK